MSTKVIGRTGTYPLVIHRAGTKKFSLTFRNSDRSPKTLTNYVCKMQIRERKGGPVLLEVSSPSDGITITANLGQVSFTMSSTKTATLNVNKAWYDILLYVSGGDDNYVLMGPVTVIQNITEKT